MKKILTAVVVMLLAVSLFSGCERVGDRTKGPTKAPVVEQPVVEQPLVDFLDEPEELDYKTIFIGEKLTILKKYYGWSEDAKEFVFDEYNTPDVYLTGTFNKEKYATQKLYITKFPCDGPCFGENVFRFTINPDGTWVLFKKYSAEWGEWDIEHSGKLFDSEDETAISQLEYPDVLTDPETGTSFKRSVNTPPSFAKDLAKYKIFEDKTVGPVYINRGDECSFATMPDGMVQYYDMVANFSVGDYVDSGVSTIGPDGGQLFDITWNNGTKEKDLYSYKGGYGGFGQCFYVKNSEYPMDTFTEIGKTGKGDSVYGFSYPEHQALQDFYSMAAYPEYATEGDPSYEEFLAKHPLFYWKDAYGRLIEFGRSEFKPVAEMGKPVIYLYPEKDMDVNVRVEPKNGLSISEPLYGRNGWNVLAKKGGSLVNSDGKIYPYLFWEGLNLDYRMPQKGFVVARVDVEKFLKEKLAVLGLNDVETADFMEFWYPKFNSAPYYYITFADKAEFDKLAPLTVTPAPDSVVRVYMDYAPLARPIKVTAPVLVTPERKGFAVVEWGGALRR